MRLIIFFLFFALVLYLATISRGFRYFALICEFCFSVFVMFGDYTIFGLFLTAVFGIWLLAMMNADRRQMPGRALDRPPLLRVELSDPPPIQWFYAIKGSHVAPTTVDGMRDLLRRGSINQDTLVWNETFGQSWKRLRDTEISEGMARPPPLPQQTDILEPPSGKPFKQKSGRERRKELYANKSGKKGLARFWELYKS
jgi:hypothetical protein